MKQVNQKYLCITDHGVMGAVPQQISESEEHNLHPLFGCEMYVNSMQPKSETRDDTKRFRAELVTEEEKKKFDKSSHLLGIAYNNQGYKNLVRLTSWGWIHGFYKKPRVNHDVLDQFKEGIIFTSTCANSEIANALFNEGEDAAWVMLDKYIAMFGEYFYLEIMMLDYELQKPYNLFLIKAHEKYGIPVFLSQDCFVAGTPILTKNGFKFVEDVEIGEYVLTHKNRWRKVEATGSRPLKQGESVYLVKTKIGGLAYEATGNHEAYVGNKRGETWSFGWKRTDELQAGEDYLLIPKIDPKDIFSESPLEKIDLMPFLDDYGFQLGNKYESSNKGNMACRLQFNEEKQEFWSYRGWDRKFKTVVPRYLEVDEEFLSVLGWYVAEGWSEKKSNQVGFALHKEEQDVADWLIEYFSKFGIEAKTYKVSENGIAVRFSSVVFNQFFGRLCGYGANNKHLPRPDKKTWMRQWSRGQLSVILRCYWRGDGRMNSREDGLSFDSTSKILIYEITSILLASRIVAMPCVESGRKENWADSWHLNCTGERFDETVSFLMNEEFNSALHRDVFDIGEYYAAPVKKLTKIDYEDHVYCFQVEEDHSLVAGLYGLSNCHYCSKEHSHNQHLQLLNQRKRTLAEAYALKQEGVDVFELQDTNLWMKSEDELNSMWERKFSDNIDYELFKQAKANTIKICEKAKGVEFNREIKLPKMPDADDELWEATKRGFVERGCPKSKEYGNRIREEFDLIKEKDFSSYFIIQQMMTDTARRVGPELLGFGDGSECVGPGRGCLSFDSRIQMPDGTTKPIGEVDAGNFVRTKDGSLQKVVRRLEYPIGQEDLVCIKTYYGDGAGVILTKDHEVWAERQQRPKNWHRWAESTRKARKSFVEPTGKLDWVSAGDIQLGDWMFVPLPKVEGKSHKFDLAEYAGEKKFANGKRISYGENLVRHEFNSKQGGRRNRIHQRFVEIDEIWGYVLGLFTGDGWTVHDGRSQVEFCFHSNELANAKYIKTIFSSLGADITLEENYQGKQVIRLCVKSIHFRLLFDVLFDKYEFTSDTKHVPDCILDSNEEVVISYLKGYLHADGHEGDSKLKWVTTSRRLADQIRFLLLRIGLPSSLGYADRTDERKDFQNTKPSYGVVCPLDARLASRDPQAEYVFRRAEGGILLRVREVSEVQDVNRVYDLEVENNHDYSTSSYLVHNSVCGSLVAYCLGLHDVEPIIHDLKFSRFLSPARGGKQARIRSTIDPIAMAHEEVSLEPELEVLEGKIDDITF